VQKQIRTIYAGKTPIVRREKPVELDSRHSMELMTRDARNEYLRLRLRGSPRYKAIIEQSFSTPEKELFEYEYCELIKSMDSLNEAEEQMFFSSLCEYVLAQRARNLKSEQEQCVAETLVGRWVQGDPRFLQRVSEQWSVDEKTHMERYESLMKSLKLSRAQRLDKRSDGNRKTLLDIAQELSHSDSKNIVADEIAALDRKTNEELKRLLDNGYLYGVFDIKIDKS